MSLDKVYKAYKSKVEFFLVYIREAHPTDGSQHRSNTTEGILYKQPTTLKERAVVAKACTAKVKFAMPCLVDDMKNSVNTAYSAWPTRIYVIGTDGKVLMKGPWGPRGSDVRGAEKALKAFFAAKPAGKKATTK